MLQQLVHIIIISFTCIIWGTFLSVFLKKNIQLDEFWYNSAIGLLAFLFCCGCISLSIFSSWLCLFLPLRFSYLFISTLLPAIYLVVFKKKEIKQFFSEAKKNRLFLSATEYVFIAVCCILFLVLTSLKPVNSDTQIYHLQIILWQSEYGTVPGIANLFARFGLGSNWFNLISFFRISLFKNENFSYVNVTFVIWFFIWLFSKWKYFTNQQNDKIHRILALFYFQLLLYCMYDWQLFRDAANSTNYDFEVTAFVIISISFFIEQILLKKTASHFSWLFILFALSVISFKFSGIFIVFLILYYLLLHKKTGKALIVMLLAILIIVPVLLKNYITTGYPLFPYPLRINKPDWQLPYALANGIYVYILDMNRFFNYWFVMDKVPHTFLSWVPYWYKGILIQHKITIALTLSSLILLFLKPRIPVVRKELNGLIITLLLMAGGWFFTAPDPGRFGYGVLLPASFLVVSITTGFLFHLKIYRLCLIAAILVTSIYTYKTAAPLLKNLRFFVYPMNPDSPPYKNVEVKGIPLHIPEKIISAWNCRCFITPLPCLPMENPYLEPRGKSLKDGFRMQKQTDSIFIKDYAY